MLQKLETLDEKRLQAQQYIKLEQLWIFIAFNKKVKKWVFEQGNLIPVVRRHMIMMQKLKSKF